MEFKSDAQKNVYEKVKGLMTELHGESTTVVEDKPIFWVQNGSASVQVAIFPWGDDDATVCVRSWVVTGADVNADLGKYLLRENADMRFGAFGVDQDGDITFEHAIVGSTVDKNELRASIRAVAVTADKYDDEIVSKYGGERSLDRMNRSRSDR